MDHDGWSSAIVVRDIGRCCVFDDVLDSLLRDSCFGRPLCLLGNRHSERFGNLLRAADFEETERSSDEEVAVPPRSVVESNRRRKVEEQEGRHDVVERDLDGEPAEDIVGSLGELSDLRLGLAGLFEDEGPDVAPEESPEGGEEASVDKGDCDAKVEEQRSAFGEAFQGRGEGLTVVANLSTVPEGAGHESDHARLEAGLLALRRHPLVDALSQPDCQQRNR